MRLSFPAPLAPRDAATEAGGKPLGDLPEWDLSDLYTGPTRPSLPAISRGWKPNAPPSPPTTRASWPACRRRPPDLHRAHEKIDMIAGRIMSFAGLRYYQQTTNPERAKFLSDMPGQDHHDFTTPLVFFTLEFNRIEDDRYDTVWPTTPTSHATSPFSTGCAR
jgi:oligoendopeptidase F